jgi:hypothetical protein
LTGWASCSQLHPSAHTQPDSGEFVPVGCKN